MSELKPWPGVCGSARPVHAGSIRPGEGEGMRHFARQGELFNRDKVQESVDILRYLEPGGQYAPKDIPAHDGYRLAFSGGKDSVVIKQLAIEAGVKFTAHYNLTTLDPPELVRFIRKYHREVIVEPPAQSFRSICINKRAMLPTRQMRFCCEALKEKNPPRSAVITGIRAAESGNRAKNRDIFEFSYNDPVTVFINPIFRWLERDVWGFIHDRNLPYCELYDQGWTRVGCLFCPMAGTRRKTDAQFYPKHASRMVSICDDIVRVRRERGLKCTWGSGKELFDWWLSGNSETPDEPLFSRAKA
jgi:phosphoadenosine phosphosulfate reductase